MSEHHEHHEHHEKESALDRYWPLGLIVFGIAAVMILVFFKPGM
jgi:hypothetical protein